MFKTEELHVVLRTTENSRIPIADFMPHIEKATRGTGVIVTLDPDREGLCVLKLPSHFCSIRARNMMQRLMVSATDGQGVPQLDARLSPKTEDSSRRGGDPVPDRIKKPVSAMNGPSI